MSNIVHPKIDRDMMEDFESDDDDPLAHLPFKSNQPQKSVVSMTRAEKSSLCSSTSGTSASASETLASSHAMKMGIYTINLGTAWGQRLHTLHMVILPLIPVLILLAQNIVNFVQYMSDGLEIKIVQEQVADAVDLSVLLTKLQEERGAVAFNIFLDRPGGEDSVDELQQYVRNGVDIRRFTLLQTFNGTDQTLQALTVWPAITNVAYFESKLKFQIQHSIFRTKIREGNKGILEVIKWYNEIIAFLLDYISSSIKDSDVSNFYRYIIAFKNLLRSVEFSWKSSIYGIRYLSYGYLDHDMHQLFVRYEVLRKEYVGQTFNFIPDLKKIYDSSAKNQIYEAAQTVITLKQDYDFIDRDNETSTLVPTVDYFTQVLEYTTSTKAIVDRVASDIETFVDNELNRFKNHSQVPFSLMIILSLFVPVVVFVTLQSTTSMFRFSKMYDDRVEVYKQEKKKTEKLLTDLLPRQILRQMKRGQIPQPETFESVTIFLCDIVGFTNLSSESTAHQIVELLNKLYNLFDNRLEEYDVYKVETIGDAYMIASGVPERNDNHASEIAKVALDLLAKLVSFEVPHKPGYRLQLRMGVHSGSCVAGVVGTKIPHYSIFGESVEIAGLMESSGEPMKIQVSQTTKEFLKRDGTFNYTERTSESAKLPPGTVTFWLLGRRMDGDTTIFTANNDQNSTASRA